MKKIIPAILFACIAFYGCNSNQKKDKSDLSDIKKVVEDHPGLNAGTGTYSITAPEGWTKKDTVMSGLSLTAITSPIEGSNDNFMENINVVTEKAKGYDLDAYTEANQKNMVIQTSGFETLDKGETTIGGMPAKWILYNCSYSGYSLKNTVYFIVKNGIGYVITCTSTKAKFDKYQTEFKSCVNSFTIND
jgi:hypothetical protein